MGGRAAAARWRSENCGLGCGPRWVATVLCPHFSRRGVRVWGGTWGGGGPIDLTFSVHSVPTTNNTTHTTHTTTSTDLLLPLHRHGHHQPSAVLLDPAVDLGEPLVLLPDEVYRAEVHLGAEVARLRCERRV